MTDSSVAIDTPAVHEPGLDAAGLEQFRPGLYGYCYRMLASPFEADDAVQETMIRAWQHAEGFEGRSAVRTWLYRIATNVCLDMLRGRARRATPMDLGPAISEGGVIRDADPAYPWVLPVPDARLGDDPADRVVARETIRLAFVAALAHLPARQRAVLILREVLGWPAAEVAELLEMSVASVNSALQRARATVSCRRPAGAPDLDADEQQLLADYIEAFERYDMVALTRLLRDDATQTMPPYPIWLKGAADITGWMTGYGSECRGSLALPIRGNGCLGLAQYRSGGRIAWAIHLLEMQGGLIAGINTFVGTEYFELFGLPAEISRRDFPQRFPGRPMSFRPLLRRTNRRGRHATGAAAPAGIDEERDRR